MTDRAEANKAVVLKVMELLIDPEVSEQARQYLTPEYIQHNPEIESGADGIIAFTKTEEARVARENMRPAPEPPVLVAEGDKVVMMISRDLPDPENPGQTYRAYWFDMWRVEDGRLAEHWDAVTKTPGTGH
ncbi:nuclear transport factor 2 family protein [Herbiconiux sp. KACC 21604]|uniref:nuclear transport factor 2 family protein n=1 Tax=unclassified Herbiconiux TaxID=2618217 RepID=UPI001C120FB3|nr:nuclear transport factor 2 family protein [Herbiconiux sp. SALV-R1]WPO87206.1 nuclear transport factor 2 family protein [Herbiconiux sp. KACC 21604]